MKACGPGKVSKQVSSFGVLPWGSACSVHPPGPCCYSPCCSSSALRMALVPPRGSMLRKERDGKASIVRARAQGKAWRPCTTLRAVMAMQQLAGIDSRVWREEGALSQALRLHHAHKDRCQLQAHAHACRVQVHADACIWPAVIVHVSPMQRCCAGCKILPGAWNRKPRCFQHISAVPELHGKRVASAGGSVHIDGLPTYAADSKPVWSDVRPCTMGSAMQMPPRMQLYKALTTCSCKP